MSKDYPKPVENGELRTTAHKIYLCAIGKYSGLPEDNILAELEALLAQEKAKWVAEVLSKCDEKEIVLMGTECKYCGDYVDYCNCHKIRQNQRDEIRQALAKLLDKENTK